MLSKKLDEFIKYENEKEWLEFKENWFKPKELGEYISAMSNSATYLGREASYFVWGVNDKTHEIVGTNFLPDQDVKRIHKIIMKTERLRLVKNFGNVLITIRN